MEYEHNQLILIILNINNLLVEKFSVYLSENCKQILLRDFILIGFLLWLKKNDQGKLE